jgi:MoxR-like ATPase
MHNAGKQKARKGKMQMQRVKAEIKKAVKGKDEVIEKVLAAMLAGGHVLLEDIPGVGKTTLAMSIAKSMSLSYKRVQFTPDVLPSDIVGFSMYNQDTKTFEYQQGAVFCNLFLADEINRTSPKTQSALLEVMEEGNVTVDGVTRPLPQPFTVIATENPLGSSGTQMLPESQLDRFMICLTMGYPEHEAAVDILKENAKNPLSLLQNVISIDELIELRTKTNDMFVHDSVYEYIVTLVEETRTNPMFSMGASPRGSISLLRMAKAMAVLSGRDYVTPEDIRSVFFDVLGHRVKLSTKARAEGKNVKDALGELFAEVKVPRT